MAHGLTLGRTGGVMLRSMTPSRDGARAITGSKRGARVTTTYSRPSLTLRRILLRLEMVSSQRKLGLSTSVH